MATARVLVAIHCVDYCLPSLHLHSSLHSFHHPMTAVAPGAPPSASSTAPSVPPVRAPTTSSPLTVVSASASSLTVAASQLPEWLQHRHDLVRRLEQWVMDARTGSKAMSVLNSALTGPRLLNANLPREAHLEAVCNMWQAAISIAEKLIGRFKAPDGVTIGVIGLEKAGKSTFLSHWLTSKAGLLPVEAERCTGTTTKLVNDPDMPPDHFRAVVHFRTSESFLALVNSFLTVAGLPDIPSLDHIPSLVLPDADGQAGNGDIGDRDREAGEGTTGRAFARIELKNIKDKWDDIEKILVRTNSPAQQATTAPTNPTQSEPPAPAAAAATAVSTQPLVVSNLRPSSVVISAASLKEFEEKVGLYISLVKDKAQAPGAKDATTKTSVAKLDNPIARAVQHVDIYSHMPLMPPGVVLIDLPGVNSPADLINRSTEREVIGLDLAIFVKSVVDVNWSREDHAIVDRFLNYSDNRQRRNRFQLVLTKADLNLFHAYKADDIVRKLWKVPVENVHLLSSEWERSLDEYNATKCLPMQHWLATDRKLREDVFSEPGKADRSAVSGYGRFRQRVSWWLNVQLRQYDDLDTQLAEAQFRRAFEHGRRVYITCLQELANAVQIDVLLPRLMLGDKTLPDNKGGLKHALNAVRSKPFRFRGTDSVECPDATTALLFVDEAQRHMQQQQAALPVLGEGTGFGNDAKTGSLPAGVHYVDTGVGNTDYNKVRSVLEAIRKRVKEFVTVKRVSDELLTLENNAFKSSWTLQDLEKKCRENAKIALLKAAILINELVHIVIKQTISCYTAYFLQCEYEGGSLDLISKRCPALQDMLAEVQEKIRQECMLSWSQVSDRTVRLIIGIPNTDTAGRQTISRSYAFKNCKHRVDNIWGKLGFGNAAQVQALFYLPFHPEDIDHTVYNQTHTDTNPHKTADELHRQDEHCKLICRRIECAVDHLCEMIEYDLIVDNALNVMRLKVRDDYLNELERNDTLLTAIIIAHKRDIWPHLYMEGGELAAAMKLCKDFYTNDQPQTGGQQQQQQQLTANSLTAATNGH